MTDLTVSDAIRQELGGFRFTTMTGARNYVAGDDYLKFKVDRWTIKITQQPNQLFSVAKYGHDGVLLQNEPSVRLEDVPRAFTKVTGIELDL